MPAPPRRVRRIDRVGCALAGCGISAVLIGIALDWLPGASPGLGAPQLTLILGGLALVASIIALRSRFARGGTLSSLRRHIKAGIAVSLLTLFVLELLLAAAGLPTWFPRDAPEKFLSPVPWWTCDAAGCHYVQEFVNRACDAGELKGRRCLINAQGFHDTQDFVAVPDMVSRRRILVLGDSFAFGALAASGKSFVEALEAHFPDLLLWNTAIPGAGTNQAVASFRVYAPQLKPQLTILGFYMNDFDDNMLPVDSYFMGVDAAGQQLSIRQYQESPSGDARKLERQSDLYYRYHRVDPPANAMQRWIGETRLGTLLLRFEDAASQMISQADGLRLRRQVNVTGEYLRQLRDLAASNGTDLLAVLIPAREGIPQAGARYRAALNLMRELEIAFINPLPALDADNDYFGETDIHWNSAGHQKVGALLIDCLERYFAGAELAACQDAASP